MSNKYISQINNTNFVYPNYELAEYDVDIIHNINNYSVSGYVTSFSATTVTSSAITVAFNATWLQNNAEVFLRDSGNAGVLSIHAMRPEQIYYKPYRVVASTSFTYTGQTSFNINSSFTMLSTQFGTPPVLFSTGPYYFEVRFIGANSIFPVCQTLNLTI